MNTYLNISHIEYNNLSFYISNLPKKNQANDFFSFLKKNNINYVVRVCYESTFPDSLYLDNSIQIFNLPYADGTIPDENLVYQWLKIYNNQKGNVLIHCMCGLGRAPLLATIIIIEETEENFYTIIDLIRNSVKNAFNKKQLIFLNKYYNSINDEKINCNCYKF